MSGNQFKCAREARPDANYAEVAPIGGQHPIDLAAFRDGRHHPIYQS